MSLAVGTFVGPYEVVAALGAGGMGEVYRARDARLGRDVAIKAIADGFITDPERVARFHREAQLLAALNHPHIATVYGLEESGGSQFLVMELVEGETLAERLTRGSLAIDEALAIARQVAEALQAAHEKGIIHRDLKPANIALDENGQVKVLDFGLAKALSPVDAADNPALTQSPTLTFGATHAGVILGTAAYMAPEQAKGKPADKRSDVWAFGCVLYEMLAGKRAFDGEDASETLAYVLTRDPDWKALPASVSPAIRALLKRSLQRDRQRRMADVSTALFVLDEASALAAPEEPANAGPDGQRDFGPRWRRVLSPAAAAVTAALLTASGAWWATRPTAPVVTRTMIATSEEMGAGSRTNRMSPAGTKSTCGLFRLSARAAGKSQHWPSLRSSVSPTLMTPGRSGTYAP